MFPFNARHLFCKFKAYVLVKSLFRKMLLNGKNKNLFSCLHTHSTFNHVDLKDRNRHLLESLGDIFGFTIRSAQDNYYNLS